MEAPPGGPPDSKRPYVAAVYPAPDTVNVSRDLDARFVFSEWVSPDAERGKVYLNPPPSRSLRTKLSGNMLEVTTARELDSNTTYTLGLLGTIRDLNGLPLEAPLQLTFSTGPALDPGKAKGLVGVFQAPPAPGAFAALYPRGEALRKTFSHLTRRNDSIIVPSPQPDPAKERPAYISPADSAGRFEFKGVRPGRYGLLGFQDINGDLRPSLGSEALAIGPSLDVAAAPGDFPTLALAPYDTVPVRLVEARWAGETVRDGLAYGTVRLKFNRPPHPTLSLSRDAYAVSRPAPGDSTAASPGGASIPVLDVCLNPNTGEIELMTAPLRPDSQYVAACPGLVDLHGNPADTAHDTAPFRVGPDADTAKPDMVFLGPRQVSGQVPRLAVDNLFPGRPITVYYPRLLADSTLSRLRADLRIKTDSGAVPWTLTRLNHHEFTLSFPEPIPLKGQRLGIGWKPAPDTAAGKVPAAPSAVPKDSAHSATPGASSVPGDSAKTAAKPGERPRTAATAPQPVPIAAFSLADASELGGVKLSQDPSAYGSRLVIRATASGREYSRVTPATPEFVVDSLPKGNYSVEYFRDSNGDGLWNPGSLSPWAIQEPYVLFADSVDVQPGAVNRGDVNKRGASAGTAAAGLPPDSSSTAPASIAERKLSWPPVR